MTYLGATTRYDLDPAPPPVGSTRRELIDGMAQAAREMQAVQDESAGRDLTVDEEARWTWWHRRWTVYRAAVLTMDHPRAPDDPAEFAGPHGPA